MKTLPEYCKPGILDRVVLLHPTVLAVLCDVIVWCEKMQIPCVVTDAVTSDDEDRKLVRASSTHREGRAFDVSCKGWNMRDKEELVDYLSKKYKGLGAISTQTNREKIVYVHDAWTGQHVHVQLSRSFEMPEQSFT